MVWVFVCLLIWSGLGSGVLKSEVVWVLGLSGFLSGLAFGLVCFHIFATFATLKLAILVKWSCNFVFWSWKSYEKVTDFSLGQWCRNPVDQKTIQTRRQPCLEARPTQRSHTRPDASPAQKPGQTKARPDMRPESKPDKNPNRTRTQTDSGPRRDQKPDQTKTQTKPALAYGLVWPGLWLWTSQDWLREDWSACWAVIGSGFWSGQNPD